MDLKFTNRSVQRNRKSLDLRPSHVVADGVWQDDNAALALLQLFGNVHRRRHGRPRASSFDD